MAIAPIFTVIPSIALLTSGRGRPITDETWQLRQRIISYLRENHGESYTTKNVFRSIKQSKKKVMMQLAWLEKQGAIARVTGKGGITEDTVWKNVEYRSEIVESKKAVAV